MWAIGKHKAALRERDTGHRFQMYIFQQFKIVGSSSNSDTRCMFIRTIKAQYPTLLRLSRYRLAIVF